ncbi:MAG: hypothetical protein P8Z37_02665 [Acidobacteriota bacterium]
MKCSKAQSLILKKMDRELSESESGILDAHMHQCPQCTRDYKILSIPRQIAQTIVPREPSNFFLQKLTNRIGHEVKNEANVQQLYGLARRLIPSMAAITLALLSIFAFLQLKHPQDDLRAAYEKALFTDDLPVQIMFSKKPNVSDAKILSAIANQQMKQFPDDATE